MKLQQYAYLCFFVAFLILFEQYIVYGEWFTPLQIHHETFAVGFVCLGIGLLLGKRFKRK